MSVLAVRRRFGAPGRIWVQKEWKMAISGPTPSSIQLRSEKDVEVRIWGDFFTGGWKLGKPCSSWFNSVAFSSAFSLSFCQRPVEKELLYPFDRRGNRGSGGESHQVTRFKSPR